jgi:hypothetical protein
MMTVVTTHCGLCRVLLPSYYERLREQRLEGVMCAVVMISLPPPSRPLPAPDCVLLQTGFASGLGAVGVALVVGAAIQLSGKTAPDRCVSNLLPMI